MVLWSLTGEQMLIIPSDLLGTVLQAPLNKQVAKHWPLGYVVPE